MGDDHVGQFAGLDANVRAHHRIGVAVIGDDVVGSLRQQHDIAGRHDRHQRRALAHFKLAALEDAERNLVLRNLGTADAAFNSQAARRQQKRFAIGVRFQGDRPDRADQTKGDVHNIAARRQHDIRRRATFLANQLEGPALIRPVGKHPPHQPIADDRQVLAVTRRERQHALTGCRGQRGRHNRCRGRGSADRRLA